MWVLDCDGDGLQGRRVWLRPGKTYLFGRTKPGDGKHGFEILHKSVSRKHLTVTITDVKPDDGHGHGPRSHLVLRDEQTKVGTTVDGTRLKGGSVTLHDDVHYFRLGSLQTAFRIAWQPVVLSFTFPSKDTKGGKDPLAHIRARIEGLDIETILPYERERTTHVVAAKRNTAKCLQALINGRFVVDHSFIDGIIYATTPSNLDESESLSPLEEDFDRFWPRALDHVPAPSKEPGQRPSAVFAPDPARQNMFEGYVFVFCDLRQFENLLPPITNAGGKALLFTVQPETTTAAQLVAYVGEVSKKKYDNVTAGSARSTTILVRFAGDKGYEDWATSLQTKVQSLLGVELVEQNEFLDVVLMNEPTRLRRPVSTTSSFAHSHDSSVETNSGAAKATDQPSKTLRPRGIVRSTFKGFDDGFDAFSAQSQSGTAPSQWPAPNPRKRSPPSEDDTAKWEDALLPAAAAMKRRRIAEGSRGESQAPIVLDASDDVPISPKKEHKPIDIAETVRERRMAADEAARNEEMALHQSLSDLSFEEMNRLAKIEDMDIPERKFNPRKKATDDTGNERWDPRWNGRKNFKRFRRQGDKRDLRRGHTVIVSLEEVKKKSQGIGEHYWLDSSSSRRQRTSHTTDPGSRSDVVSQSLQTFESAQSHQEQEVPRELADLNNGAPVDVEAPRTTRRQEHGTTGSKRNASASKGATTAKRQKTADVRDSEGSDSENELRFRIRRRNAPSSHS